MAEVLLGERNPSGRIPFSYPRSVNNFSPYYHVVCFLFPLILSISFLSFSPSLHSIPLILSFPSFHSSDSLLPFIPFLSFSPSLHSIPLIR